MGENVIYAALLGLGTVGTGVYKVLKSQEAEMAQKIGKEIRIKRFWCGIWKRQQRRWKIPAY